MPQVEHCRLRARPAALQTRPPETHSKVDILASPACEPHVEPVHPFEVIATNAEAEPVSVEGGHELRLSGSPRAPTVADRKKQARTSDLARCGEYLTWCGHQPPHRRPAPDPHLLLQDTPREPRAHVQALARKEPSGKRGSANRFDEAASRQAVAVEEYEVARRRS